MMNKKRANSNYKSQGGFTLVEILVSMGIFITSLVLILGALVSLETTSRKVRATRIAMDNVGAAIESMARTIRMGSNFHCGAFDVGGGDILVRQRCTDAGGDTILAFEEQFGAPGAGDQVVFRRGQYPNGNGNIERSTDGGASYVALTAPEINIISLQFWVNGVGATADQPFIIMAIRGTANTSLRTSTTFNVQTVVSQRTPNFF